MTLFAGEVANAFRVKLGAATGGEVDVETGAVVEPVEEVFERGLGLPIGVIGAEVGTVAVLEWGVSG